jgi:hypothetical protein
MDIPGTCAAMTGALRNLVTSGAIGFAAAAVAPPRPVARDLPQRRPQASVITGRPSRVPVRRAVLSGVSARPPFRDAEAVLQHPDRLAPARRAHQFPFEISFSAATSST